MSETSRKAILTKINLIDFSIVILAITSPYIVDSLTSIMDSRMPVFMTGILPKSIFTLSVLFLRIAIARGQKPLDDNSLSILFFIIWTSVWLKFSSQIDSIFVEFIKDNFYLQVLYWGIFLILVYYFLVELSFQKKITISKRKVLVEKEIEELDDKYDRLASKNKGLDEQIKAKKSELAEV